MKPSKVFVACAAFVLAGLSPNWALANPLPEGVTEKLDRIYGNRATLIKDVPLDERGDLIFQSNGAVPLEMVSTGPYNGKAFFRAAMTRSLGYDHLTVKKACKKYSKGKFRQIATSNHTLKMTPDILTFESNGRRSVIKTKDLVSVMTRHEGDNMPPTPEWYQKMITKAFEKEYYGVFECEAKTGLNWRIAILPSHAIRTNDYNALPPGYNSHQGVALLPITDETYWDVQRHLLEKWVYDNAFERAKEAGKTRPIPLTDAERRKLADQYRQLKIEQEKQRIRASGL